MAKTVLPPPPLLRRFFPELDHIGKFFPILARVVNANAAKLKTGDRVTDVGPDFCALLRRLSEQLALVQEQPHEGLEQTFLTSEFEKSLANSSKLIAGANITLTPAITPKGNTLEIAATGGGSFPPFDLTTAYFWDDFLEGTDPYAGDGTTVSFEKFGSLGRLGWTFFTDAVVTPDGDQTRGNAGFAQNSSWMAHHPGNYVLAASNVGGTASRTLLVGPGGSESGYSGQFSPKRTFASRFVITPFGIGLFALTGIYRIGFQYETGTLPPSDPPKGFYLEANANTGDTNWFYVIDDGTHTRVDSGIAVGDESYFLLNISKDTASNSVSFSINNGASSTIAIPDIDDFPWMGPFFEVQSKAGGVNTASLAIDFFDCMITGLTRY